MRALPRGAEIAVEFLTHVHSADVLETLLTTGEGVRGAIVDGLRASEGGFVARVWLTLEEPRLEGEVLVLLVGLQGVDKVRGLSLDGDIGDMARVEEEDLTIIAEAFGLGKKEKGHERRI